MQVIYLIKTGIAARWAIRQIEVLINQGIEVHAVMSEDGPMRTNYAAVGATVHRLPIDIAWIRPLSALLHKADSPGW